MSTPPNQQEVPEALRRLLSEPRRNRPGEVCEMCSEPVGQEHSHVIDLELRSIMCTCRGCYLLFSHTGERSQRHRAVPERFLHAPSFPAGERFWETAGIPVRMAFFFRNSVQDTTMCFYPSPGGATESLLPLGTWEELLGADPELGTVSDDVEALLLNRTEQGCECFLVPIDTCYALVGLVRTRWRGFDGGGEARQAIEDYFADLRDRSKPAGRRR